MAKKEKPKHLGRGLQSLLGPITSSAAEISEVFQESAAGANFPPDNKLREALKDVSISLIRPNPHQPRTVWDENELHDLSESIKVNGIIQPIIVRSAGTGFELIAGERRFRAAKLAAMETIPAIVRQASDEQMLELALVENIHREDLNPIERAKAYRKYLDNFSLTQAQAAEKLGENRSVVANYLRLLDLPVEIRQMLIDKQLSMGHAKAMLALPNDELRKKLANKALAGRLSVREVERLVRKHLAENGQVRPKIRTKSANIVDLEARLSNHLGTKVNVETRKNAQRGKIVIEFYSLDEFDRIAEQIGLVYKENV